MSKVVANATAMTATMGLTNEAVVVVASLPLPSTKSISLFVSTA